MRTFALIVAGLIALSQAAQDVTRYSALPKGATQQSFCDAFTPTCTLLLAENDLKLVGQICRPNLQKSGVVGYACVGKSSKNAQKDIGGNIATWLGGTVPKH